MDREKLRQPLCGYPYRPALKTDPCTARATLRGERCGEVDERPPRPGRYNTGM
jgi:hypothetical protein